MRPTISTKKMMQMVPNTIAHSSPKLNFDPACPAVTMAPTST